MYVISLKDFSTKLVDAFAEADHSDIALVLVDGFDNVAPLFGVSYDKDRYCIKLHIGVAGNNINDARIKQAIAAVNPHG